MMNKEKHRQTLRKEKIENEQKLKNAKRKRGKDMEEKEHKFLNVENKAYRKFNISICLVRS